MDTTTALRLDNLTLAIVMTAYPKTVLGTPCEICGLPIKSKAWLKGYPYATECGKDCFITAALSVPLIDSNGVFLHAAEPCAVRERERLTAARIAREAA